ncbi:MAG: hypothetical protein U0359_25435 [Byssovorax sp.]
MALRAEACDLGGMNAGPLLQRVARVLAEHHLEGILIGNAGAALQGAPVTTMDLDFFFRDTPTNRRKLRAVARALGASILRPYYPVSSLFRVVRDDDGMQLDFLPAAHGIRSFEALRSRASQVDLGGAPLLAADLADIIRSKRGAGRPRDLAVLSVRRRRSMKNASKAKRANAEEKRRANAERRAVLAALRAESEADLRAQIRRLLALPMAERTHFLRVRLPGGGSAI